MLRVQIKVFICINENLNPIFINCRFYLILEFIIFYGVAGNERRNNNYALFCILKYIFKCLLMAF